MSTRLVGDSPNDYWDPKKPPSPGQNQAIAEAALKLLGIPEPANRLRATEILARLRIAIEDMPLDERPVLQEPW